jgi:hypothetical protein
MTYIRQTGSVGRFTHLAFNGTTKYGVPIRVGRLQQKFLSATCRVTILGKFIVDPSDVGIPTLLVAKWLKR